jgi:hypothetical protein
MAHCVCRTCTQVTPTAADQRAGVCVGCQGVSAASAWVSVGQRGCSSKCCWLETWCRRCALWREGVDEVVAHDDAMAVVHDDAMADEEPQDDNAVKVQDGEATVDVAELFERLDRIADPQRRSVVQAALEGLLGPRRKRSEGADNGRRAKRPRVVVVGDVPAAHCKLCSVQLTERWPRGAFGPVDSDTKLYHTKIYCPSKSGTQPPIVAWSHDEYTQHKSEARHTQREARKRATSAAAAE